MSAQTVGGHAVLVVDIVRGTVSVRGEQIAATSIEFSLLAALARDPSTPKTREELMLEVYGSLPAVDTRVVDSHLCRLRGKLSAHGDRFVINRYALGYRLVEHGREEEVAYIGHASASPLAASLTTALDAMEALGLALARLGADVHRTAQAERQRGYAEPRLKAVGS